MPSAAAHDLWIFGYGSLMWRPGFAYVERRPATVTGYHRAFCIASTLHRGTPARPGLVLGLDRGGSCAGIAYRVAATEGPSVLSYLRERELIYGVYRETWVRADFGAFACRSGSPQPANDRTSPQPASVTALAYTVERCHPSYVGRLPIARQTAIVRGARGRSGANLDYLISTVRHLAELGIRERDMERLVGVAAGYTAHSPHTGDHRPGARSLCAAWARRPVLLPRVPAGDQRRFGHRIVSVTVAA